MCHVYIQYINDLDIHTKKHVKKMHMCIYILIFTSNPRPSVCTVLRYSLELPQLWTSTRMECHPPSHGDVL